MAQSMIAHAAAQTRGRGLFARLSLALAVWRQHNALERLDDHLLNDIGLDRSDVTAETGRPIWDAPDFWQR